MSSSSSTSASTIDEHKALFVQCENEKKALREQLRDVSKRQKPSLQELQQHMRDNALEVLDCGEGWTYTHKTGMMDELKSQAQQPTESFKITGPPTKRDAKRDAKRRRKADVPDPEPEPGGDSEEPPPRAPERPSGQKYNKRTKKRHRLAAADDDVAP